MVALSTQQNLLQKYGANLYINPSLWQAPYTKLAIDIETDEKDNFVGLAISAKDWIYYFTSISSYLKSVLETGEFIGHSLKSDAKWLKKWGINIKPSQLVGDTMLMSYVINATKESHGLKPLAKEYLGMEWSSYKEMVHPDKDHPNKKVTLDQQPIEKVAEYCAMDCLATYRLYEHFNKIMTKEQKKYYNTIELPLMQILYEMELNGVKIDKEYCKKLEKNYRMLLAGLHINLWESSGNVNPNSPKQLLKFFNENGENIKNTQKETIQYLADKGNKYAETLLTYKKFFKIHSTYLKPSLGQDRLYTEYSQVRTDEKDDLIGISTGRLSSKNPNLQNIPAHGEAGKELRSLFIPEKDKLLICADYSQIEYRLLAHFTQEPRLLEAFKNGKDIHEETGKIIGASRDIGKTINFASIYGAKEKKIAKTAKISEKEASSFLKEYWKVLPKVTAWIHKVKYLAKINQSVTTLMGRVIPLPLIRSKNKYERWHWERAAVNYIIQGSAAEIIKLSMINLNEYSYLPTLTVHDELLFDLPSNMVGKKQDIKYLMEGIVKLSIPLEVKIGIGDNWHDAKEN